MREPSTIEGFLIDEYGRRRSQNGAYSVRAFARDLGIGKSTLAEALTNERRLSRRSAERVVEKLRLNRRLAARYLRSGVSGAAGAQRLSIADAEFRLIADWYHLAILSLVTARGGAVDRSIIATTLGISEVEAGAALARLLELSLLEGEDGRYARTVDWVETTTDVPSSAIREHHRQLLAVAKRSLERDPVDRRGFDAVTIAIDPSRIPEAKRLLRECREKVAALLTQGSPSEVYTVTLNLFPSSQQ